jgi:hypothetical protein
MDALNFGMLPQCTGMHTSPWAPLSVARVPTEIGGCAISLMNKKLETIGHVRARRYWQDPTGSVDWAKRVSLANLNMSRTCIAPRPLQGLLGRSNVVERGDAE